MPLHPKVYAKVFSHERAVPGTLRYVLEYCFINEEQSGKFSVELDTFVNEPHLVDELKEALAVHLSEKYAPSVFVAKEILGCGV